jgi:hypothetical protein
MRPLPRQLLKSGDFTQNSLFKRSMSVIGDLSPSIHHITGKFPINNPNGAKLYQDGSARGAGCATPEALS